MLTPLQKLRARLVREIDLHSKPLLEDPPETDAQHYGYRDGLEAALALVDEAIKADRPLKLYVWEGVFTDYTSGLAVALARSRKQATKLAAQAYLDTPSVHGELEAKTPVVRRGACGFAVGGGG